MWLSAQVESGNSPHYTRRVLPQCDHRGRFAGYITAASARVWLSKL